MVRALVDTGLHMPLEIAMVAIMLEDISPESANLDVVSQLRDGELLIP